MSTTVRTFRAADTRAAIAAVKQALGPGAVILSTIEVPGGLFRKPQIEITAGLAEAAAAAPVAPRAVAAESSRVTPEDSPLNAEFASMRASMESMRRELHHVATGRRAGDEYQLPPAAAGLFAHLRDRGVEETVAEELVRHALDSAGGQPEKLFEAARGLLGEWLMGSRAPWQSDRGRRVLALVGPTGVGKTTTLAKIGARAVVEANQKVALITIDTYRIGASEQLTRYGQIMNVPAFVAKDEAELSKALSQCQDADLVLIDTAGRSTEEAVTRQTALLRSVDGVRLQLVLAATASGAQLASVAERYRALRPERLIFTKLDEAVAAGSILSAAVRIARPVACVTDGQRVPEDLHPVEGSSLVDRVIGSWTHGRT
jgi:flagellar biosynthesis protein FlhF